MRWIEFFEGDDSKLSSRVLCTFAIVFTLCIGVIMCLIKADGGTAMGLAGILSTLMGVIYGIGKTMDASVVKASMPTTSPVNVENVEKVTITKSNRNAKS